MSRRVEDLHPEVAPLVRSLLASCRAAGIEILITCTWRSEAEQADLFAIGRTRPGRKVTWARPGQSLHNFTLSDKPASLAVDVVPLRFGKPVWGTVGNGIDDDPTDDIRDDLELWQRVGLIGERAGLTWAGRWNPPKREFPHFQHRQAKSIMRGVIE